MHQAPLVRLASPAHDRLRNALGADERHRDRRRLAAAALAATIGAKPPRRIPRLLARVLAGEAGVVLMTEVRGASNAKAKRELGWTVRHPSWREGFSRYGR